MNYIAYNREERNLCAHLFRLLHIDNNNYYILSKFLEPFEFSRFDIFTEVALIRDAYFNSANKTEFLDELVKCISKEEKLEGCTFYSELDGELKDPSRTHPSQIALKAKKNGYNLTKDDEHVYKCLQAYFNAKPDLAIILDNQIVIYEAKLTMPFNPIQMERTKKIAAIWSKLLFEDLGFDTEPDYKVKTLGLQINNPDISWERIRSIAAEVLNENDKSLFTLNCILDRWSKPLIQHL